ncbi:MAG: ROK family protein [Micrococcales bacterium]|nr:ROK family protein [Micrococcales bacterium]NBS85947.1 ROK family protein [Micrococcales bacterium]
MSKKAIGIDIGGTGIKGALVDTKSGVLLSERLRYETPKGGAPKDIAKTLKDLISQLPGSAGLPVGICFPAVVQHGVTLSAANVSKEWIGLDADAMFEKELGREVHVINDADAAGIAEVKFGAARGHKGLVIVTTLGTGIGTALMFNGKLVPNAELGHLQIDGVDYESKAAYSAKERENLSWAEWAKRLQKYFSHLEALLTPDLFIVGGGVSKEHESYLPLLKLKTPIIPAENRNSAGILGAAHWAKKHATD